MTITHDNKPYRPYGVAQGLLYCHAPEVLMEGPAGTGKTRALLEKANLCALKYPGMRALLVRKTRESMTESVLVPHAHNVNDITIPMARYSSLLAWTVPAESCPRNTT
jgi:phage terminase large subunit